MKTVRNLRRGDNGDTKGRSTGSLGPCVVPVDSGNGCRRRFIYGAQLQGSLSGHGCFLWPCLDGFLALENTAPEAAPSETLEGVRGVSDQGYFVIGEVEVLIKYPNPTPEQALDAVIDWAHEFLVSPAREGVESELIDFSSVTATVKHGRIDEVTFYIPDTDARVVMVRKGSTSVGLGDDTYPIYQFDIRQY